MLIFNDSQCVKIENEEQFEKGYPYMRSAKNGISYRDWVDANNMPKFPIYLEWAGQTVGYIIEPKGTWTGKPLQVLPFDQAFIPITLT